MKNIGNSASSGAGLLEAQIAATNCASGKAISAASESTAWPAARAAARIFCSARSVSSCAQRSRSGRHNKSACPACRTTTTTSTRGGVATSAEAIAVRIRLASAEDKPLMLSIARPTPRMTSERSSVISLATAARAPSRMALVCSIDTANSASVRCTISMTVSAGT